MNKLLTYAIVISVAFHVGILGVIGGTSASKPIEVESLKLVKVDLVKSPDKIALAKPDQPKPETKPDAAEPEPYVPPMKEMKAAPPPSKKTMERVVKEIKVAQAAAALRKQGGSGSSIPGDPGGSINLGSTSARGENLGDSGTSAVGVVSNNSGGGGTGSGKERGVGNPDPTPGDSGPNTTPAVASPPPPPPPQPKKVEIEVCAESGMKPGRWCEKKKTATFSEQDVPTAVCNQCKEPHKNRLADRAEPELIKDPPVQIPESVAEEGINTVVKIEYTVDEEGFVKGVKVVDSSGNRALDRAIVDAAKKMKYRPAVQGGVPRAVKMIRRYPIKV